MMFNSTWLLLQAMALMFFSSSQLLLYIDAAAADVAVQVSDTDGQPVANAVVWFSSAELLQVDKSQRVIVDQVGGQFVPALTVIPKGTVVEFPNSDPVSHQVYSYEKPNDFEFSLYKDDQPAFFVFNNVGVVKLACNIHDGMLGHIVVVDTPNYAITDRDGIAAFTERPAPAAAISVWSAQLDPLLPLLAAKLDDGADAFAVQVAVRQKFDPMYYGGSLAWGDN